MTVGRLLGLVVLIVVLWFLVGCAPAPQAEGQLPLPGANDQRWTFIPMAEGPGLRTACVKGDRLYVMQSVAWRSGEWYSASREPLAMAISPGACK